MLVALAGPVAAQSLSLDLGAAGAPGATARLVQLTALIGLLSLAPSLLIMATAFTRIVIVLALLRSAIGAQGVPPESGADRPRPVLTLFVMQPVFEQAWLTGILPMSEGRLDEMAGLPPRPSRSASSWPPTCAKATSTCSSTSPACLPRRRSRRPTAP
jgi:flagellar biosynthetic protein FliP